MGKDLAALKRGKQPPPKDDDEDYGDEDKPQHPALRKLRQEADARGVTLASGGEGGLPPEVVLQVMRRDGYRCKRCGGVKGLSVHHKGRHLENVRTAFTELPKNDPKGIVTVCEDCHDDIHDDDRAGHGGPGDDPEAR